MCAPPTPPPHCLEVESSFDPESIPAAEVWDTNLLIRQNWLSLPSIHPQWLCNGPLLEVPLQNVIFQDGVLVGIASSYFRPFFATRTACNTCFERPTSKYKPLLSIPSSHPGPCPTNQVKSLTRGHTANNWGVGGGPIECGRFVRIALMEFGAIKIPLV